MKLYCGPVRPRNRFGLTLRSVFVTLLTIFVLLAFGLILLLWGGTTLIQGWLYQDLAGRIPIRACSPRGRRLALFFTVWCLLDTRSPGKYDTLFEFSNMEITDYNSFESVIKTGKPDPNKKGAFVFDPNGDEKITIFKKRLRRERIDRRLRRRQRAQVETEHRRFNRRRDLDSR